MKKTNNTIADMMSTIVDIDSLNKAYHWEQKEFTNRFGTTYKKKVRVADKPNGHEVPKSSIDNDEIISTVKEKLNVSAQQEKTMLTALEGVLSQHKELVSSVTPVGSKEFLVLGKKTGNKGMFSTTITAFSDGIELTALRGKEVYSKKKVSNSNPNAVSTFIECSLQGLRTQKDATPTQVADYISTAMSDKKAQEITYKLSKQLQDTYEMSTSGYIPQVVFHSKSKDTPSVYFDISETTVDNKPALEVSATFADQVVKTDTFMMDKVTTDELVDKLNNLAHGRYEVNKARPDQVRDYLKGVNFGGEANKKLAFDTYKDIKAPSTNTLEDVDGIEMNFSANGVYETVRSSVYYDESNKKLMFSMSGRVDKDSKPIVVQEPITSLDEAHKLMDKFYEEVNSNSLPPEYKDFDSLSKEEKKDAINNSLDTVTKLVGYRTMFSTKTSKEMAEEIVEEAQAYDGDSLSDKIKNYCDDVATNGCNSGAVPSMVYYDDTNDFYDKNEEDIQDMLDGTRAELGDDDWFPQGYEDDSDEKVIYDEENDEYIENPDYELSANNKDVLAKFAYELACYDLSLRYTRRINEYKGESE